MYAIRSYYDKLVYAYINPEKKILAGANLRDPKSFDMYDNVLVEVTQNGIKTLYKQRVPVPIAMWNPFSKTGAKAYINGDSIINYHDQTIGVFICYEQLLTFTYFQTMSHKPNLLLGISNLCVITSYSIHYTKLYDTGFIIFNYLPKRQGVCYKDDSTILD